MTDSTLLASVAAAAAAGAAAPAAPETPAPTETASTGASTAPASASPSAPAVEGGAAAGASAGGVDPEPATQALTARAALELTALAFPNMSATLTKLAMAADGGEAAFRSALLAERTPADAPAGTVSTVQTSTSVKKPGEASSEGRGAGLKAAAAAQNSGAKAT